MPGAKMAPWAPVLTPTGKPKAAVTMSSRSSRAAWLMLPWPSWHCARRSSATTMHSVSRSSTSASSKTTTSPSSSRASWTTKARSLTRPKSWCGKEKIMAAPITEKQFQEWIAKTWRACQERAWKPAG